MNFLKKVVLVCVFTVTATMTSISSIGETFVRAEEVQSAGDTVETADSPVALANKEKPMSGKCGDNLTWVLDDEGTLIISGVGEMYDYGLSDSPWDEKKEDIRTVKIEAGVSNISSRAFSFSKKLTSVSISNSVTCIGDAAFWMCTNLGTITIPNSVTTIGSTAFAATKLNTVTIPGSVINIGNGAFSACRKLNEISVSEYNNYYCSENGVLFNKNKTNLIQYPEGKPDETYVIPSSVKSIDGTAFSSCDNLVSVTIPDGVTKIGDRAFSYCNALTEVTIPNSVTSIVDGAFYSCDGLSSVKILGNVTNISAYAFYECENLTSVIILGNVINIDRVAFYGCANLTSVILPISVKKIDEGAFSHCDNLKDVYYSGTKEQWNKINIHSHNDGLKNGIIHYDYISTVENFESNKCGDNLSWELDENGTLIISGTGEMYDYDYSNPSPWNGNDVVSVYIGDGVTSIGNYAFGLYSYGLADNSRDAFVPKSLKRIGQSAFGSAKYTNIFYSGSKEEWNSISKPEQEEDTLLTSICHFNYDTLHEDNGISGTCGAHLSWTLDDGVLTISGTGEMYYFTGVEAIAPWWKSTLSSVFNKSVTVKSVIVEDGVSSIGGNAFIGCPDVMNITLPESIVTIEGGAFFNCSSLRSIFIPKSTTKIYDSAGRSGYSWGTFANCDSLTEIKVDDDNPYYKSIDGVLFTKDGTELIAYPAGKQSEKYTIPSSVITIETCAFESCNNLRDVIIPYSVTSIGMEAFVRCTSLSSITMPHSITSVGWYAFEDCTSLKDVYYLGTEGEWKDISIGTDNEALTKATIHYNCDLSNNFDKDIYHANKLIEKPNSLVSLKNETPSTSMQSSLSENVNEFWIGFSKWLNVLNDPSSIYNYVSGIDQRDMYEALILDSLKESMSNGIIPSELQDGVKLSKELVSDVSAYLKSEHLIDVGNTDGFKNASNSEISEKLEEWFKATQPDLASLSKSFKWISTGFKVTGCLEDIADYYSACITLAQADACIIEILEQSQQYCAANYGKNDALTQAFSEVLEMYEYGSKSMWTSIDMGIDKIVGVGAAEYLVDKFWETTLKAVGVLNPETSIILAAISAGQTVVNGLVNTDDVAEQYIKMKSITDIESVIDKVLAENQTNFKSKSDAKNARLFLNSMWLTFQMRYVDCDQAIKYLEKMDKGLLNKLPSLWGDTRKEQIKGVQTLKNDYQRQFWNAQTFWIESLKDDFPNSGLYEKYSPLLESNSFGVNFNKYLTAKKIIKAHCPVNVYVYDSADNVVAYIED